ncbi:MAG: DsbA family protein [Pseudomonadota bacterium]
MKRRFLLGGMGAGAAIMGGTALLGPDLVAPAMAQDNPGREIPEMTLGAEDAPVEFIEYASFTCPHCARFHEEVYPQLKADYIDQGTVRFIYREVYFDRFGLWATMVARCAGPERFFGVTDLIYANQREWTQGDAATVAENLRRIGRTAGLSDAELESCLTDGEFAQALVDRYEARLEEHEVPGTPTFIINGVMHGNMPYSDMQVLLDGLIAEA